MIQKFRLRIKNASQLVVLCSNKERVKIGKDMDNVQIIENGCMIVGMDGCIVAVGSTEQVMSQEEFKNCEFETDLDCAGKSVIPGLVDGHTHPVWCGDRCYEFAMKLAGATYMDIHKKGGGIGYTVSQVRNASTDTLEKLLEKRLDVMLRNGTTLVEAKSGYGLDTESEVKMLKVIHNVKQKHSIDIVANYLGAHSIPKGKTLSEYKDEIINEQIPKIASLKKEGVISPEFIDVFHEKGVFETEETKEVLLAGKQAGLDINFHGDELHPCKSAELAAALGATAVCHLEKISDEGVKMMAEKGVVGVLLPTTAYILRIEYPPARNLIDNGVPVAIASDFNPNAHCSSLPFVMNLSCVQMKMTMNEALVAATLNAAAALKRSHTHGSLEVGKVGDCVIVDHGDWRHLIYELVNTPINMVVKAGKVVYSEK